MHHGDNPPIDPLEFLDFQPVPLPDHYPLDWNSDGFADIEFRDTDGNGIPDQCSLDLSGDAKSDLTIESRRGMLPDAIKLDLNGDGRFDVSAFDTNGDLWPDLVATDLEGDARHELVVPVSLDGLVSALTGEVEELSSWAEIESELSAVPTEPSIVQMVPELNSEPIAAMTAENIIDVWDDQWHQQRHSDTCAICCQEFIIEGIKGIDVDEDSLLKIAADLGVYDHGTPPASIGALLAHFGIDAEVSNGHTIEELAAVVNAGHGVIIGVDSNELWGVPDVWEEIFNVPGSGANHALQVIGVESDADGNQYVIVNDPGIPHGRGLHVPAEKLNAAWRDSHGLMCVTNQTIPV